MKDKKEALKHCLKYSIIGGVRLNYTYEATQKVISNNIPGSIVECGLWKGGSVMAAMCAMNNIEKYRNIIGYDTFEGMVGANEKDIDINGSSGVSRSTQRGWMAVDIDTVWDNLRTIDFDYDNIKLIKGDVMETFKDYVPENIALLRLDTDFYTSTLHELKTLYPLLSGGGILIVDDYGWWEGSAMAVHEYFGHDLQMHKIDGSGIWIEKGNE